MDNKDDYKEDLRGDSLSPKTFPGRPNHKNNKPQTCAPSVNLDSYRDRGGVKWYLEGVSSALSDWIIPLDKSPFTIGRGDDCNLTLHSKWVSRNHAQIQSNGDLIWIRDLGSINGTFLNSKRITESELLNVNDVLNFAGSEFRITTRQPVRLAVADTTSALDFIEEQIHCSSYKLPLLKLLSERNVVPHFQSIVTLSDQNVLGYEILGRILSNDLPKNPSELFKIADLLGYSSELSTLFREEGIQLGKQLNGFPYLFVNTTPSEMCQTDDLVQSLKKTQEIAPSNRIVVEVNENAITSMTEMERFHAQLKDLNIGLAYDDFGVGQSRLVELAKAPPDFLKFDISIIRNIHLAPKRLHHMVLTLVNAARDLGSVPLAEGVECREESETCQQLGFELAQGYFYSKPLPITMLGLEEVTVISSKRTT